MRSVIRMSGIAFATLLLSLLALAPQSVQAATLTVSTTADAGAGSLRQAIVDATSNAEANTIVFNIPLTDPGYSVTTDRFTITLLSPLLNIPLAPLTINNNTGRGVTVRGNNTFRIFTLVNSAVVVINNLTISHGSSSGVGDAGRGGGIFMGNSAVLTLNRSIVSDNTATNGGGGIWMNNSGVLHVEFDSTISNNTTTSGDGGGIRMFDSSTLNITRSTVSGNTATVGGGGGIYNSVSGTINATNITVNGNTAGLLGGGINTSETPATATVNSSTISGNTATIGGGGIFNGPTSIATLNNTLVALNTSADGPDLKGVFNATSSLVGNADGSTTSGAGNQLGTTATPINPRLGPLQDNGGPVFNGGPTFTRALLAGSPAIDAGATALATDQRGVSRPQDGDGVGGAQPDIGSFESEGLPELTINDVTVTEPVSGSALATFTVTLSRASTVAVSVDFATAAGTASAGLDYMSASGILVFAPGDTTETVTVTVFADVNIETAETFTVNLTNGQGGVRIPDNQGIGTILDAAGGPTPTPTPPTNTIQFSASSYPVGEGDPQVTLTVTRTGDTTGPATVRFATSDTAGAQNCNVLTGVGSSRCDYEIRIKTIRFAAGETSKTISVFIIDDSYLEGPESFDVSLTSPTGAALGAQSTALVNITDNLTPSGVNPIDTTGFFVHVHYLDFLNRLEDAPGLAFWTNEIDSCGANQQCIADKRTNVSAAFYLSIEFQQTGYLVERIYKTAYGDGTGTSTLGGTHQIAVPIVSLLEFLPDTQEIGENLIVGQTGWEAVLENNKQALIADFVQRARFTTAFPTSMSNLDFVNGLNVNAGNPLSTSERDQLVTDLNTAAKTRAQVLRAVAEDPDLVNAEFNRAFVLMQYLGYMRRNPNDAQDTDHTGYDFWLTKLNSFTQPGDDVLVRIQRAEMVKAFITSIEYRQRFGQ